MKKEFIYLMNIVTYILCLISYTNCGRGINCCVIKLPPLSFTSERTSLEKQILGTYKEIREDVWLVSSSQTVEGLKISSTTNTNMQKELNVDFKVIKSLETIEYNKEKIQNFKAKLYIGEDNQGLLSYIENSDIEKNPEIKKEIIESINEVNDSRLVLMLEVINRNESFTLDDLPKVRHATAEINQRNALPGEWIQSNNDTWIKKK